MSAPPIRPPHHHGLHVVHDPFDATPHQVRPRDERGRRFRRALVLVVAVSASAALTCWIIGRAIGSVVGSQQAPWILGRAAGITGYLLLIALVSLGLVLSHPWRSRIRRPSTATRLRLHVSLSMFTFAFIVLHVVVLATDSYAGVGWRGALLPMAATYRPLAVTLGVIGLWAGLLAGLTAAFAGRVSARIWWPIHKVAVLSLVLVWLHGVLAGSDTAAVLVLYVVTGVGVVVLAISRYAASTPADRVADLISEQDTHREAELTSRGTR